MTYSCSYFFHDLCRGASQMEGMVTDLQLAQDKQHDFDSWMKDSNSELSIDMNVTVLTTGFWPSYKSTELALPKEMADGVEVFNQ